MQTIIKNIHISPKKSRRILIKKLFGSLTESIRRDKFYCNMKNKIKVAIKGDNLPKRRENEIYTLFESFTIFYGTITATESRICSNKS